MGIDKQTDKTKISLKIDSDKQEIKRFTKTLNSFGNIVYGTIKEYDIKGKKATFYVEKLDHGSFIIDFICAIEPIIPTILTSFGDILFDKINTVWNNLLNKKQPETIHELNMMKNTAEMLDIITKNSRDTMHITINISGINHTLNFTHGKAMEAINYADTLKMEEKRKLIKRTFMFWGQKNFTDKESGNKVIIPKISLNSLNVAFKDKEIEKEMTSTHPNFPDIEWQNLCYVVDVEYVTLGEKPQYYYIIKNYSELTNIYE